MLHTKALACAIAAMCCPAAYAGGVQTIDTIIVAAVKAVDIGEIGVADAATTGTIRQEQIQNRPHLRTGEVLEAIPGLIVTQHSGTGKANQFFLRGFNLDHGTDFRTTIGGMPINLPTHAHGHGYTDLNFMIPELIDSITYKKGPYYAEEGDFSSAGAANIEYMKSLKQGFVQLEAGRDSYGRLVFANSNKVANGDLLYAFESQVGNGPFDVPEKLRKYNGVVSYTFGTPDNRFSIAGMAYKSRWTSTDQIPQRLIDDGTLARFGSLDPSAGGNSQRSSVSAEWLFKRPSSTTLANAYHVDYRLNLFSNFTYFLEEPERGDQFLQVDKRNINGFNIEHAMRNHLFSKEMTNSVGFQFRQDNIKQVGLFRTFEHTRNDRVGRAGAAGELSDGRVKQISYSVFARNSTQWAPWLRTVAGVRGDFYDFDVESTRPENSGKLRDKIWSPKLSAIFGPWNNTEFYLNFGRGFHSNDARGMAITIDPVSELPVDKVSPLVRTRGSEIGVRLQPTPRLQTSLALWRLDLDSELIFVGDAGTTEASRPSHREGIEFANYWRPTQGIIVDADVAISRARFRGDDEAGNRIPGAIEKTASAGVTFDDIGPWFGGVRMRYFGPRPLIEDNSVRSQQSTLFNLKAGYKLNKNVRMSFDVLNVFDRKVNDIEYFYESRLRDEPEPVADKHIHPAEPRTVRFTVTASFLM
jgi:outer membrane receptor protein involved in Fe transport